VPLRNFTPRFCDRAEAPDVLASAAYNSRVDLGNARVALSTYCRTDGS
jgi:hypothetical protein